MEKEHLSNFLALLHAHKLWR